MTLTSERRFTHEPVLLPETLARLVADESGLYLDATLGLGGHARAVLERIAPRGGKLLGLDADPEALAEASRNLAAHGGAFRAAHANFRDLEAVLTRERFFPLSGALFDLGVSSLQLDKAGRGFSFLRPGPLDMRMDPAQPLTAERIVNRWPPEQIAQILKDYGEEPNAERIARAIVSRRAAAPLATTADLASLVESVVPRAGHHPATRTFQALRIAVNRELDSLDRALTAVVPFLKEGGRLCVISFHSLEDRAVKNAFAGLVAQGLCAYPEPFGPRAKAASSEETARNPRARSAKIRVVEKKREVREP